MHNIRDKYPTSTSLGRVGGSVNYSFVEKNGSPLISSQRLLKSMSSLLSESRSSESQFSVFGVSELELLLQKYTEKVKIINLENELFERFLGHISMVIPPSSIENARSMSVHSTPQLAQSSTESVDGAYARTRSTILKITESIKYSVLQSGTSYHSKYQSGIYPNLTVAFRLEMTYNELDELRKDLAKCQHECGKLKLRYTAEIESKRAAIEDIRAARSYLEQNVVGLKQNNTTILIPAEKLLRYLNESLKGEVEKLAHMRIKVNSSILHLNCIKSQIEQKIELGETILPVDFEQLKLENKEYAEKLEGTHKYFLELKTIIGRCNSNLSEKKKNLDEKISLLNNIIKNVKVKEILVNKIEIEELKTNEEVLSAYSKYAYIKDKVMKYKSLNLMDLVKMKANLRTLERNIKIMIRRNKLQETTIESLSTKVKNKNQSKKLKPVVLPEHYSWSRKSFRQPKNERNIIPKNIPDYTAFKRSLEKPCIRVSSDISSSQDLRHSRLFSFKYSKNEKTNESVTDYKYSMRYTY